MLEHNYDDFARRTPIHYAAETWVLLYMATHRGMRTCRSSSSSSCSTVLTSDVFAMHLSRPATRPHNNECMRIPSSTDECGFQRLQVVTNIVSDAQPTHTPGNKERHHCWMHGLMNAFYHVRRHAHRLVAFIIGVVCGGWKGSKRWNVAFFIQYGPKCAKPWNYTTSDVVHKKEYK